MRWWWKALLLISVLILNDAPVKESIFIWLWGECLFGEAWQISDWILGWYLCFQGFPGGLVVKNLPAMQEPRVWSLAWEDTLEKEMATYSSILACVIPWIEDPGRLQSTGHKRVRYDLATEQQQQLMFPREERDRGWYLENTALPLLCTCVTVGCDGHFWVMDVTGLRWRKTTSVYHELLAEALEPAGVLFNLSSWKYSHSRLLQKGFWKGFQG